MFQKLRPFLLLFVVFLIIGAWLLASFTKGELLLAVNSHWSAAGDLLMPWWTNWGDGATHIVIIVGLIAYAWWRGLGPVRWGWLAFLAFALPSLVSQVLKSEFFNREPRPVTYFNATPSVLHHVPGVDLWTYNSFPSGHTITAFSIALTLLYLTRPGRIWSYMLFAWALSVGYSRMYLAEHFFKDVYGGAIIGVACTLLALWLGERTLPRKWRIDSKLL
jgi:membrane-associated phospholipid phosphatase